MLNIKGFAIKSLIRDPKLKNDRRLIWYLK
jgi:hypothetical protein